MHSNVSHLIQSTNRFEIPVQSVIKLDFELLNMHQVGTAAASVGIAANKGFRKRPLYSTPQLNKAEVGPQHSNAAASLQQIPIHRCLTLQITRNSNSDASCDPSVGSFSIDTLNSTRRPCLLPRRCLLRLINTQYSPTNSQIQTQTSRYLRPEPTPHASPISSLFYWQASPFNQRIDRISAFSVRSALVPSNSDGGYPGFTCRQLNPPPSRRWSVPLPHDDSIFPHRALQPQHHPVPASQPLGC